MKNPLQENPTIIVNEPNVPDNTDSPSIVISKSSGSKNKIFTQELKRQVLSTVWMGGSAPRDEVWDRVLAALAGLESVKPENELEGMLGAQLVATHQAAMECYRRAMFPSSLEERNVNLSQANKLSRSYAVLLESLQRYRGKGMSQQKVIVEHVHVYPGGQAIVGNVEPKP